MMFFSSCVPREGVVVKVCKCGRKFTADDWLDLACGGLMGGINDYTLLELRHCPCKSTLALNIPFDCAGVAGTAPSMGDTVFAELKARFYKRPVELWFIHRDGKLVDVLEVRDGR